MSSQPDHWQLQDQDHVPVYYENQQGEGRCLTCRDFVCERCLTSHTNGPALCPICGDILA